MHKARVIVYQMQQRRQHVPDNSKWTVTQKGLVHCTTHINLSEYHKQRLASIHLTDTTVPGNAVSRTWVWWSWIWPGVRQAACAFPSERVSCSRRPVHVISLAAAFCTNCSRWYKLSLILYYGINDNLYHLQATGDKRLNNVFAASSDNHHSIGLIYCSL